MDLENAAELLVLLRLSSAGGSSVELIGRRSWSRTIVPVAGPTSPFGPARACALRASHQGPP
eukprot:2303105-Prymnesium_polylepis.2